MSDRDQFLERLNAVISWELAGAIQYLHHASMVTGPWRASLHEFFSEGSEEARGHAEMVAERVVALGGVPSIEPARVRIASGHKEMLEAALALEQDALAAWEHAYALAGASNPGTAFWMEEAIAHEQEHVDHLRKLTAEVDVSARVRDSEASSRVG